MNKEHLKGFVERRIRRAEVPYPCYKTWTFYYDTDYVCVYEFDINNKLTILSLMEEYIWSRKLKLEKIKEKYES